MGRACRASLCLDIADEPDIHWWVFVFRMSYRPMWSPFSLRYWDGTCCFTRGWKRFQCAYRFTEQARWYWTASEYYCPDYWNDSHSKSGTWWCYWWGDLSPRQNFCKQNFHVSDALSVNALPCTLFSACGVCEQSKRCLRVWRVSCSVDAGKKNVFLRGMRFWRGISFVVHQRLYTTFIFFKCRMNLDNKMVRVPFKNLICNHPSWTSILLICEIVIWACAADGARSFTPSLCVRLARATYLLADIGNTRVIECFAQVIEDLVRGEVMQLGLAQDAEQRFSNYIKKSEAKTASLLSRSCKTVSVYTMLNVMLYSQWEFKQCEAFVVVCVSKSLKETVSVLLSWSDLLRQFYTEVPAGFDSSLKRKRIVARKYSVNDQESPLSAKMI